MIDFPKYCLPVMMIMIGACQTTSFPEDALDTTFNERKNIMQARMLCEQQFKTFIFHGRGYKKKEGNYVIMGEGGLDNSFRATCK
jgi:hypothetical protein